MDLSIGSPPNQFTSGLRLIGASCEQPNKIRLSDEVHTELGKMQISWKREANPKSFVPLPVYLYANRTNFLFCLDFDYADPDAGPLSERSVAVIANNLLQ